MQHLQATANYPFPQVRGEMAREMGMTQWQRQRDQQQDRLNAASRVADPKAGCST